MNILLYPDPRLRRRALPVKEITPAFEQKVRELFKALYRQRGIGLAAPQVGWNTRVLVLNLKCDRRRPELEQVLLNPTILEKDGEEVGEEGCLSFPGLYFPVQRAKNITVRFFDLQGEEKTIETNGLYGRALQHEMDHLDGILFTDRADLVTKTKLRSRLKNMERAFSKKRMASSRI